MNIDNLLFKNIAGLPIPQRLEEQTYIDDVADPVHGKIYFSTKDEVKFAGYSQEQI